MILYFVMCRMKVTKQQSVEELEKQIEKLGKVSIFPDFSLLAALQKSTLYGISFLAAK